MATTGGEFHPQLKEFLRPAGNDARKHAYLCIHSLMTALLVFSKWEDYLVLVSFTILVSDRRECLPVRQKVYQLAREFGISIIFLAKSTTTPQVVKEDLGSTRD